MLAPRPGGSQDRSGGVGLTSSIGALGLPLPAAAGRRGIPRRSMSWSCTVTMALAAEIRSWAGALGSWARSPRSPATRRSLSTIWAGRVARATDRIVPVRFSLIERDFGLTSGVAFSRLGMTDNDRQTRDSPLKKATSPHLRRNAEIPEPEDLTHKGLYESVATHI